MNKIYKHLFSLLIVLPPVCTSASELRSGEFSPPRVAPDFRLQGSNGKEIKLADYRGKVVALGFGFTSCPEVCPTTLAELTSVRKQLGISAQDFQVVYVTVDPERDTAKVMQEYVTAFDPSFIGVTGTPAQLAEMRKEYGITAVKTRPNSAGSYGVDHSSVVFLIDKAGKLRALSPYGRSVDDMVHDVRTLLDN